MIAAVGIWLVFAILAVTVLSPALRLLTFALTTGALVIAAIYEINKKDIDWKQVILLMSVVWMACGVTVYAAQLIAPKEEPKGPLLAGNDPTPPTACHGTSIPRGGLLMILGQSGVIGQGRGPFTPFRVGSCPAISLTRTAGGLEVNAFGYDSDNNVVYRIRANVFNQIVGGFLTEHRPDRSTLVIGDDHGPRVMEIRYLNKDAVEISGTFRCGDSLPVQVSRSGISVGKAKSRNNRCITLDNDTSRGFTFSGPDEAQNR